MSDDNAFDHCRRIEYRAFLHRLADLVGRHQVPVRTNAVDINEILDNDPVHYDLIYEVVRSIYRNGRCSHLDAEVRAETVFNALGCIRGRLLADKETDVDQVNLLEELGWASRVLFAAAPDSGETPQTARETGEDDPPVILQHPAV